VLQDVPPRRTVAGVPAREIGPAGCEEPALTMDQLVRDDVDGSSGPCD
jgi:serine O-acetyltransferase